MPISERTQLVLAKSVLGFWVIAALVGAILLLHDIIFHFEDYWYSFGIPIMLFAFVGILWGLGASFVWSIRKVFPADDADKEDTINGIIEKGVGGGW